MDLQDKIQIATISEVRLERGRRHYVGTLNFSLQGLIFFASNLDLMIHYPLIDAVVWKPIGPKGCTIHLRCRDFMTMNLVIQKERDAVKAYQSLQNLLPDSIDKLPALIMTIAEYDDGWDLYDPVAEYSRMGVGTISNKWRISEVNIKYQLCDTYPQFIGVPASISDLSLMNGSKFRSRGRIPILSYLHSKTLASLTRCSQPLSGISGMQKRNAFDEELIRAIFLSNQELHLSAIGIKTNLILDARPRANAYANAAMGKGFESPENYHNCQREFLGIENIHVMRDSLNKLVEATNNVDTGFIAWSSNFESSNWLKHIILVLEGAIKIVKAIGIDGSNVLVHCSDGWDRTAQLTSVAQVLMDPYFRTIRGLEILIEKEWLSMGFKFEHRNGHFARSPNSAMYNEHSPVFTQFLDCVWQIMQQFPREFEFTDRFLIDLFRVVHSCEFGTFLKNCERERKPLKKRTGSAWSYLNSRIEKYGYLNPLYKWKPKTLVPTMNSTQSQSQSEPDLSKENSNAAIAESPSHFLDQDDSIDRLLQVVHNQKSPRMSKQSEDIEYIRSTDDIEEAKSQDDGLESCPPDDSEDNLREKLEKGKEKEKEPEEKKGEDPDRPQLQTQELQDPGIAASANNGGTLPNSPDSVVVKPLLILLFPNTNPTKIKLWRTLYCPNDFEPVGEMKAKELEAKKIIDQMEKIKASIEVYKDEIDPSRVEKKKEEEAQRKLKDQKVKEKRQSVYDFELVTSLVDETILDD